MYECSECNNQNTLICNKCTGYINKSTKPSRFEAGKQIPIKVKFAEKSGTVNESTIKETCEQISKLLVAKNHDYGNSVKEQFDEWGLPSILIRLDDKLRRLKTLHKVKGQLVDDESMIDTLTDLAGYSTLGIICLKKESKE